MKLSVICVSSILYYQGAVQGPQEFAIGFAFGVRSLVSHTVGKDEHRIVLDSLSLKQNSKLSH